MKLKKPLFWKESGGSQYQYTCRSAIGAYVVEEVRNGTWDIDISAMFNPAQISIPNYIESSDRFLGYAMEDGFESYDDAKKWCEEHYISVIAKLIKYE